MNLKDEKHKIVLCGTTRIDLWLYSHISVFAHVFVFVFALVMKEFDISFLFSLPQMVTLSSRNTRIVQSALKMLYNRITV